MGFEMADKLYLDWKCDKPPPVVVTSNRATITPILLTCPPGGLKGGMWAGRWVGVETLR